MDDGISRRRLFGISGLGVAALAASSVSAQSADPGAMKARPDHIQLGIADLDEGIAFVRKLTGVEPAPGGAHPGYGTRNALISLGEGCYLEILALDPAQMELRSARTDRIRALAGPTILTFAMQTTQVQQKLAAIQNLAGLSGKLDPRSRKKPDGSTLEWTNVPIDSAFGPQIPFFIDWRGAKHPSMTTPAGCQLTGFEVLHPDADALRGIYRGLDIDIAVTAAANPGFVAHLATPRGPVALLG
jgi:hypothetical protein